jgi:hypothetical protein
VETIVAELAETWLRWESALEGGLSVGQEVVHGDGHGLGTLQGVAERVECGGELRFALEEQKSEASRCLFTLSGEAVQQMAGTVVLGEVAKVLDMDVEVADRAGGAAKLLQLAKQLRFLGVMGWKSVELVEEVELSLDATSLGTELVDDAFARLRPREE